MYTVVVAFVILTVIAAFAFYFLNVRIDRSSAFSSVIGSVIILLLTTGVGFGTTALISSASIKGQLVYKEFWNGFEKEALKKEVTCVIDGSCRHTYDCDPYQVLVTKTRTVTDSEGKSKTETYTELETRYHDCPYSKQETTFYVTTTLGGYLDYGKNLMTGEKYRGWTEIPGGRKETPKDWLAALNRINDGKPWGITEIHEYDNFILSSKSQTYKKYSDSIDNYIEAGVMPAIPTQVHRGVAAKLFLPPTYLSIPDSYGIDVMNLNGAMAADKRFGDLRVVVMNSTEIPDADNYTNALHAYWSNTEVFGRFALPKNAVVVVLGVDRNGSKVDWARAFTGMPIGNEEFIQGVSSRMKDAKIDENLLGRPFIDKAGNVVRSNGVLESILWDESIGFNRVSMSGDDTPSAGFLYLGADIQPTTGAVVWMGVLWGLALVGSIVAAFFAAAAIYDSQTPRTSRYSTPSYYSRY